MHIPREWILNIDRVLDTNKKSKNKYIYIYLFYISLSLFLNKNTNMIWFVGWRRNKERNRGVFATTTFLDIDEHIKLNIWSLLLSSYSSIPLLTLLHTPDFFSLSLPLSYASFILFRSRLGSLSLLSPNEYLLRHQRIHIDLKKKTKTEITK